MSAAVSAVQLAALRKYAGRFAARPPIFASFPEGGRPVFPFAADSDRGLGVLLLYAALYRPGGEARAAEAVAGLYRSLGLEVFKLNRIPFPRLKKALEGFPFPDAEERRRAPGILRSVCDFFYRAGSLKRWLAAASDWEHCVRELSERIYWMGKRSRLKTKARHFLWLCALAGCARCRGARGFSWPVSRGHGRYYRHILRPPRSGDQAPESRQEWFSRLASAAFPEAPWKLFAPLEAYLRPDPEHGYLCRKVQGGCRPCPLSETCPAAPYLIPAEKRP